MLRVIMSTRRQSASSAAELTLCCIAGYRLQQLAVKNEVPLWEGSDDGSTSGEEDSGKSVSRNSGRCCASVGCHVLGCCWLMLHMTSWGHHRCT